MRLVSQFLCPRNETSSILVRGATGSRQRWRIGFPNPMTTRFDSLQARDRDGCRRLLVSPAKKPSRSVTEHLHNCSVSARVASRRACPFSTMAVHTVGIGADRVRFSEWAPAVVKAPASAVRVTTAICDLGRMVRASTTTRNLVSGRRTSRQPECREWIWRAFRISAVLARGGRGNPERTSMRGSSLPN